MPRACWLGLLVCVVAVSPVAGQNSPRNLPVFPSTASSSSSSSHATPASSVFATNPSPPASESPLKDLTPSEFGDLIPPPDPHAGPHCVPGHLTPTVPEHAGFYGTAEYLLFRPRSDSFDYALVNADAGLATVGPIRSLGYNSGNGLRAELGYHFDGGWDVGFAYTHFQASGSTATAAAPGQILLPTITRPGLTDTALTASANADLNYNLYDVIVGKRFVVDERFAARVFAGVRIANIRQRFDAFYDGLDAAAANVNRQARFRGYGPIVGGEAVLGGPSGFHLYARGSGGLLSGRSGNSVLETNNGGATLIADTRYSVYKVVPVASISVGGGWQYRTISIRAGYEVTQWFGLTQPVRFVDDVGQGKINARPSNFSLEGFFVQAGFAF